MDSEKECLRRMAKEPIPSQKSGLQCYTEVELLSRFVPELTKVPLPLVLGEWRVRSVFRRETVLDEWRCQRRIMIFRPKDRPEWMHFSDIEDSLE